MQLYCFWCQNTSNFLGSNVRKRTFSNVSFESMGDLFSDTLSVASGGSFGDNDSKASSVQNVGADDLKNKTLDMQRKMLMQANTRLVEDLKNEKKNVMIIKEKAHRKYKQLQVAMHAEMKQLQINLKAMSQRLQKKQNQSKQSEFVIADLQKKYNALQTDYNMRVQSGGMEQMQNYQALDANNKQLINQCEKYRRELGTLKQTILSCNDTMQQQQKQILVLNQQLSEQRKLNGFGGGSSSSEQLLQKQIRLLKSQRRMLIQELKDLREQNDKLKNMIVTGENLIDKK